MSRPQAMNTLHATRHLATTSGLLDKLQSRHVNGINEGHTLAGLRATKPERPTGIPVLAKDRRSGKPSKLSLLTTGLGRRGVAERGVSDSVALLQSQTCSDRENGGQTDDLAPQHQLNQTADVSHVLRRRLQHRGNTSHRATTPATARQATGATKRGKQAKKTMKSSAKSGRTFVNTTVRTMQSTAQTVSKTAIAIKTAVAASASAALSAPILLAAVALLMLLSLLLWFIPTVAASSENTCASSVVQVPDETRAWVSQAAQTSGLNADFIAAIMKQESGFNPDAYASDSNGGTWGLLQMNRSVWRAVHPDGADQTPPEGITDPMTHAHYGGVYLKNRLEGVKQLKAAHPNMAFAQLNDLEALVVAHNAGEGNLMKYPNIPATTKQYLESIRPTISTSGSCSTTAGATTGTLTPPLVMDGNHVNVAATGTPVAQITTYSAGQCTWWAAARRLQINKPVDGHMGDGWMWAGSAQKFGYPTGGTVQLGDVASFAKGYLGASSEYGHVAIVEEIHEDGSIVISESGSGHPYAWLRTLTKEQVNNPNITFIH